MLNGLAEASTESIKMSIDLIGKISLIWEIVFNIQIILKYNKIGHNLNKYMGQHMISFYVILHFGHVDLMGPMVMSFIDFTSSPQKIGTCPSVLCCKKNSSPVSVLLVVHKAVFSSAQFSRSVMSDSLRPHESQHARPPCPSPTPGVHSDSRPSSQ